jgi:CheY-like chemotaxis protein
MKGICSTLSNTIDLSWKALCYHYETPMQDTNAASEPAVGSQKSDTLVAFSAGLNRELDSISYPAAPRRSSTLAKDLGVGRTQAYRLLNGFGGPSIESLLLLRGMGVSVDRILDNAGAGAGAGAGAAGGARRPAINVLINGQVVPAVPQRCRSGVLPVVAAFPVTGERYELRPIAAGHAAPADAIPVEGLSFPSTPTIAVVDDDLSTLEVLSRELSTVFRVVPFQTGQALIGFANGLAGFNAFLVDWRLPDIDGEAMIQRIRKASQAPVFILTGYTSSDSAEIARALDWRDVHHVAKPADALILIKRMSDAMK